MSTTSESENESTAIVLPEDWHIHFDYTSGPITGRFLRQLQEERIEGRRCPKCEVVWMPPRAYCERCFVPTDGWVDVGPAGTIEAATVITQKFVGVPDPPYAMGFVRLDGADTALAGVIAVNIDPDDIPGTAARLAPGTRVEVVFHEDRVGRMTDFHYKLAE